MDFSRRKQSFALIQERRPFIQIITTVNRICRSEQSAAVRQGIGVIASNTSVSRENLKTDAVTLKSIGNGGVSGQPISSKSTQVIKYLSDNSQKAFPIIGVGGIHSEKDALDKLSAGADLVQIYTGFIYEGPTLVKRINKAILKSSLNL